MNRKILLCAPVSKEELDSGKKCFPQFSWVVSSPGIEIDEIKDAEIVFGKPPESTLAVAMQLKWLQAPSAGVEHLAASQVFQKGTFTLTTAAGMHESCVQHAIALMLGFTRRVALHAQQQNDLRWKSRETLATPEVLEGKTLGVLGLGVIGRRVCQIARVLGMHTIGLNYHGKAAGEADEVYPVSKLDELLQRFDVLLMILPATPQTDNILNAERIAKLRPHCLIVNVGRGNAIDEEALIIALKEKRIAGAALDVFKNEPLPADSPFYSLPNVVITPHIGGNRPDYDSCAFGIFMENLRRYSEGQPLKNVVDRQRRY